MPTSIVLQLQAVANGRIQGNTGRAVHGFWYQQWGKADPAVAAMLHAGNGVRPFTLSPLMGLPRPKHGTTAVSPQQTAWIRFTALHDALAQAVLQNWLTRLPAEIELAGIRWAVQTVALTPAEHPWGGQTDYRELQAVPPAGKWRVRLLTPTAFRTESGQLPFPMPHSLVNSWLRRWQTFAPVPLPADGLIERLREQLFISGYQLKTVPVRHGRRLEIGCVGDVTLNGRHLDPADRALVTTLAHYAFYCGSGRHTTQGMGMTRAARGEGRAARGE